MTTNVPQTPRSAATSTCAATPVQHANRPLSSRCIEVLRVASIIVATAVAASAQTNVFHRSDAGTGLWTHDANVPWFYQADSTNRNRPDATVSGTNRHNVFIGHNNELTMDLNGTSWYNLRSFTLQGGTTLNRTFNSSGGAGMSLTDGLYILSGSGSHTFNNQFGVDASTVTFSNNGGAATLTNTIFVNANTAAFAGSGNMTVSGVLQGTGGKVTKSGSGTLTFSGTSANTYSGLTTVSAGTLSLSKTSGVNAIAGDLLINGGTVSFGGTADNQIADSSNVTLSSGTFNLGARAETINSVAMTGGTLTRGGNTLVLNSASSITGGTVTFSANNSQITAASTLAIGGATFNFGGSNAITSNGLVLGGNVTYAATNAGTATFANTSTGTGRIDLNAATRTFDIADSNTLAAGTPEVLVGWSIQNGGVTKSGTGLMALIAANTYTGATTISGGTLQLGNGGTTGTLHTSSAITNNANFTINRSNTVVQGTDFSGSAISGSGSFTQAGSGTTTLNAANTYQGLTTINAGVLSLDNNNTTTARLANTSGITVNSGGTLRLTQTGVSSVDRINNAANVTIAGGGKFETLGLSEGVRPSAPTGGSGGSAGMGALTLQSTSSSAYASINFGSGALGSSLVFSSLSNTAPTFVDIFNWTGTPRTDNGATGNDRLLFADTTNLTTTNLANWRWYTDDSATAFMTGATVISYGDMYEVVPIPEPSTYIIGALAVSAIVWMRRKQMRRLLATAVSR
jgi:fibronectin-binding autotransporter adhesin